MIRRADIVIVGGGPVGAALAMRLASPERSVMLLDSREAASVTRDVRPIALSYGSRLIMERLGVWDGLAPATAIEQIHVSQRGALGRAMLTAREARVPALGYVVDYAGLVSVFDRSLAAVPVESVRGARVTAVESEADAATIHFETASGAQQCVAALAVIADGGGVQSPGAAEVRDYAQSAITGRVSTSRPHRNVAFERFTTGGPIALLPYADEYALVWTLPTAEAGALMTASDAMFLSALSERFGERVGRFIRISARAAHPLSLRVAREGAMPRVVAIGNAAQALHPVAGQGFNLGLRDAWELACAVLAQGLTDSMLASYRARRRFDRAGGIGFTDSLITLFSNDSRALALARGAGLALIDNLPPVKDFLVRRMMFGARG